jgi:hypothetical protein
MPGRFRGTDLELGEYGLQQRNRIAPQSKWDTTTDRLVSTIKKLRERLRQSMWSEITIPSLILGLSH